MNLFIPVSHQLNDSISYACVKNPSQGLMERWRSKGWYPETWHHLGPGLDSSILAWRILWTEESVHRVTKSQTQLKWLSMHALWSKLPWEEWIRNDLCRTVKNFWWDFTASFGDLWVHLCHEENGTDSGGEGVVGLRRTSPALRGWRQHQRRGPGYRARWYPLA